MIGWLYPAAFVGLSLLAGPILIHLLLRQRALRVPFPSLRFVVASRTAAVRLRMPSDLVLLAVRLAILALAIAALAQPVVVTSSRLRAWNGRTVRAVVVDTSASMQRVGGDGRAAALEAGELATAESGGASEAFRVETADLTDGLRRASADLVQAGPARREIVVISDFQRGALTSAAVMTVPAHIGLRFVQVGTPEARRTFGGATLFGVTGSRAQSVTLSGTATGVIVTPGPENTAGLRLESPDAAAAAALARTVAAAGAPAPSLEQPMAIVLRGGRLPAVHPIAPGWMLNAVLRLARDRDVSDAAAADVAAAGRPVEPSWFVVSRDRQSHPLVRAAAAGNELVIDVDAAPDAFVSAAVVRAALTARAETLARPEEEIDRIPLGELAAWSRKPAATSRDAWRSGGASDARWCWALVLALLALEAVLRNSRRAADQEAHRNAA